MTSKKINSIIKQVLLEQPGPGWIKIAPSKKDEFLGKGCEVKQGTDGKWYLKDGSCPSTPNPTPTPAPTNTTTTTTSNTNAIVSPPFPKCVSTIPGVYRNGNEAIFTANGIKFTLNIDGTYYNDKPSKGTWVCASDTLFQYSPEDTNQTGGGNFPDCVKGLKKANDGNRDYYYSTGTDNQGNQYDIMFYSEDKKTQDGTEGHRCTIVPKSGSKAMNGVYMCVGENIRIISWDGNITLNVKGAEVKQPTGDSEADLEGVNRYNVGELELYYGDYYVDTVRVGNAVRTVLRYLQDKYRSRYFNYFLEMLVKMKDYATSYNRPKDVTFLENQIKLLTETGTKVADLIKNYTAELGNERWDPFSDPDQLDDSVYKEPINFKGRFPWENAQQDIMVYQLTDELMSRTDMDKTQQNVASYMRNFTLTKENCKTELKTLLTYAGKTDLIRGIFDKRAETVNVGRGYNPAEMQAVKQRIVLCNGGDQPQNSMYTGREKEALNYLATPEAGKFRIDFGADNPGQQPK